MAAFLEDSFTDTDGTPIDEHAPDTGAGSWVRQAGSGGCTIELGRAAPANTAPTLWRNATDPGADEYAVELDVVHVSDVNFAGPAARVSDVADTCYYARHEAGAWHLYQRVAGTDTSLGSSASATKTGTIRLEITNATKKLYVDGVERVSSATNAITARGFAGFRQRGGSSSSGYHVDNLLGETLAAAGVELAATIASSASLAGDLRTGKPLAATIASSATVAGTLAQGVELAAVLASRGTLAGALRAAKPLAATIASGAGLTARLTVGVPEAIARRLRLLLGVGQ